MISKVTKFALASLAAACALGVAAQLPPQEKKEGAKPEAPAAPEAKPRRETAPFRGRVVEIDKTAMTIKVGTRTFQMTSSTRITKAGKPATFDEIAVGDMVTGQYKQGEGGKLELVSLRIVPAVGKEPETPGPEKKKEKETP